MARADFMATQKIRLFGSWSYSYMRQTGSSAASLLPKADDAFGQFNSISTNSADLYNGGIGSTNPNVIYNTGADITLTPSLVATTRFGYFYQDLQDRGLPVGNRYVYRDTNYPYSTTNAPALATTKALNGTVLPSKFVNSTGWSNIGVNTATVFDQWKRYSFNQDLAYFKKGFGTHNLKFGYSFSHGLNDVINGYNTSDVWVAFNTPYAPQTTNGIGRCKSINARRTCKLRTDRRFRGRHRLPGSMGHGEPARPGYHGQGRRLESRLLRAGCVDGRPAVDLESRPSPGQGEPAVLQPDRAVSRESASDGARRWRHDWAARST